MTKQDMIDADFGDKDCRGGVFKACVWCGLGWVVVLGVVAWAVWNWKYLLLGVV